MNYFKILIILSFSIYPLNTLYSKEILSFDNLYDFEKITNIIDQQESVWVKAYISNHDRSSCPYDYCGKTDKHFILENGDSVVYKHSLNLTGYLNDAARNLAIYFNRNNKPEQVPSFFNQDWDTFRNTVDYSQTDIEIYSDQVMGIFVKLNPATNTETYINNNQGYSVVIENGIEKQFYEPVQPNIQAYADRQTGEIVFRIDRSLISTEMGVELAKSYIPVKPEITFSIEQLTKLKQKVALYKKKYFSNSINITSMKKNFYGGRTYLFHLKPELINPIYPNQANKKSQGIIWELLEINESIQDSPVAFISNSSLVVPEFTGPPRLVDIGGVNTTNSKSYQSNLFVVEGYVVEMKNLCSPCPPEGGVCDCIGTPYILFASDSNTKPNLRSKILMIYPTANVWKIILSDLKSNKNNNSLIKKYRILLETKIEPSIHNSYIHLQQTTQAIGMLAID